MQGFSFDELLTKYRYPLLILLGGLILISAGYIFLKTGFNFSGDKVEILESATSTVSATVNKELVVEISGAVTKPGVYRMVYGSRVDDLIIAAGGFSVNADRNYTDKYLNRAAKLIDGEKIFISSAGQHSEESGAKTVLGDQTVSSNFSSDSQALVNINTASLGQLDSLPGIGQVYAQNIIEHRPYSNTAELVSKGAIKQSLYEKIKEKVSVY